MSDLQDCFLFQKLSEDDCSEILIDDWKALHPKECALVKIIDTNRALLLERTAIKGIEHLLLKKELFYSDDNDYVVITGEEI